MDQSWVGFVIQIVFSTPQNMASVYLRSCLSRKLSGSPSFPRHPGPPIEEVWMNPQTSPGRLLGVPNTYLPGIWRILDLRLCSKNTQKMNSMKPVVCWGMFFPTYIQYTSLPVPKPKQHDLQILVGGFNPVEKYSTKLESSPSRGKNKKYLKTPPRKS